MLRGFSLEVERVGRVSGLSPITREVVLKSSSPAAAALAELQLRYDPDAAPDLAALKLGDRITIDVRVPDAEGAE